MGNKGEKRGEELGKGASKVNKENTEVEQLWKPEREALNLEREKAKGLYIKISLSN